MKRASVAALFLSCAVLPLASAAQAPAPSADPPPPQQERPAAAPGPRGPADIIGGAGRARAKRELEQAATRAEPAPPSAAPVPAAPTADPHAGAGGPHAGMAADDPQRARPIATERPDASLPDGTIRVLVTDQDGAPAKAAEVSLGIMGADSTRTSRSARTGADGVARFTGLAGGERQAYRVNVPYQGAKYSSTPFRLSPSGGYQVEIQRLPVTRDARLIVLYVGATSVELKDDRLHVVQQSRLWNVGSQTYVFPDEGVLVPLPHGFMAVQIQESMTDQHVKETKDGLRITGSIPPGEATLLWGFDLPSSGTEAHLSLDIPWTTFAYRVITDAPTGLSLSVQGMPEAMLHGDAGRKFLVTEMQRKIGDEPFKRLDISLRGIPGPGPGRWIAVLVALFLVGFGIVLSRTKPAVTSAPQSAETFAALRDDLLDRVRALEQQQRAGEIGPEYHAEQLHALKDELAALLYEESELKRALTQRT